MKVICTKCQREMIVTEIGVVLVEMALKPPQPYKVWIADLKTCPGCGVQVVSNLADRPLASTQETAKAKLEEIQRIGQASIFYDYEIGVEPQ